MEESHSLYSVEGRLGKLNTKTTSFILHSEDKNIKKETDQYFP